MNLEEEKGKMNKHLIIIGIAVLLICVGLSGCNEIENDLKQDEEEKDGNGNTSDNDFGDDENDWLDTETVIVSGVGVNKTVNILDKSVKLVVSGSDNIVTVTKATNLVEVVLSGIDCIVRVSITHSFTSTISGVRTEIVYYD